MQLQQHEQAFLDRNVAIVVVTFEADVFARGYVEETGLAWPLLIDETRDVYRAYDMFRAGFWNVWGPRTWWAYLQAFTRGQRLRPARGDVNQRGGDVLIDPAGLVRLHHVGTGPADRPSIQALLDVLD